MQNTGKLAGYTLFITGASRGIGKAIGIKAAKDGANVVIAAKTAQAHPKLEGTIYTAAQEIEDAGGKCLPCIVDIRDEKMVTDAVDEAVKTFGGIDILVNNASAISLTGTLATPMKKYDLMNQVNARGTYLCSRTCLPHLLTSQASGKQPHILNLSPPLSMKDIWFQNHVAYTIAKYGMSMNVLGMSAELKEQGVSVNALWPRTAIYTAAMEMMGGKSIASQCRKVDIMSDAAYAVLTRRNATGNFYIDDEVLAQEGIKDMDQYAMEPGQDLMVDLFVDDQTSLNKSANKIPLQKEKKADSSSASSGGAVGGIFDKIKLTINDKIVSDTQGVYKFQIGGKNGEIWYVDLKNGPGKVTKGGELPHDVTMSMSEKNFVKMFDGELSSTAAFMTGRLRIDGDMVMAMKLEKLMRYMNKNKK